MAQEVGQAVISFIGRDEISKCVAKAGAAVSKFTTGISGMAASASAFGMRVGKSMTSAGDSVIKFGKSMKWAALAAAGGLMYAANETMKFQSSMNKLTTLVDIDAKQLGVLKGEAISTSIKYAQGIDKVTAAYYEAIKTGVPMGEVTRFVGNMAAGSVGNFSDMGVTLNTVADVMDRYKIPWEKSQEVMDAFTVATKYGEKSIEEIGASMGMAMDTGAAFKIGYDQILASMAGLTQGGMETSDAFMGIQTVLNGVVKQSPAAVKAAKQLGVKFDLAAIQSKGFAKWIGEVGVAAAKKGTKGTELLSDMFGRIKGVTAVMALGTTQADEYAQILGVMGDRAGETAKRMAAAQQGLDFKWNKFKAGIQAAILDNDKFGDSFGKVLDKLNGFVDKLNALPAETKNTIASVVSLGAAFLALGVPIIIGVGYFIKAAGWIVQGASWLIGAIGPIIGAVKAVFAAISAGALATALVIGTIVLAFGYIFYTLYTDWEFIKTQYAYLWKLIKREAQSIWDGICKYFWIVVHAIGDAFTWLGDTLWGFISSVGGWFAALPARIGGFFADLGGVMLKGITDIGAWFASLPAKALAGVVNIKTMVFDWIIAQWNAFIVALTGLGQAVINAIVNPFKTAATTIQNTVGPMLQKIRDLLPGSDAKTGPLTDLFRAGAAIPGNIIEGMSQRMPELTAALRMTLEPVNIPAMAAIYTPEVANGGGGGRTASIIIHNLNIAPKTDNPKGFADSMVAALKEAIERHGPI